MKTYGPLLTTIGPIELIVCDGGHIFASSRPLNVDPVIINTVPHFLSLHLWKTGSGTNVVFSTRGPEDIYLSRSGRKNVSPAARKYGWIVVVDAVNAWLRQNPTVLDEAQAAHETELVQSRMKKILELRAQIKTLEAEITDLSDENYRTIHPQPQEA